MKRILGLLRVLGLAIAILGLLVALTLRRAQAQLVESLRGFGDQIARLHDLSPHSAPRKLMLNGLELHVMTAATPLNVKAALDRFQRVCHSAGEIDLPAKVRQQIEAASLEQPSNSLGVFRRDAEREGILACIDVGQGQNAESFLARLQAFGKTHNLRSVGQLRYALARRSNNVTTLIMFWTEGDALLTELIPKNGDASGQDLAGVPRPSNATRTLSAFEFGMPYGLAFYHVEGRPSRAVTADYQVLLAEKGWVVTTVRNGVLLARKAKRSVVVSINEKRPGRVVVAVSDLG